MVDANLNLLAFDRCRYMEQKYCEDPFLFHTESTQEDQLANLTIQFYPPFQTTKIEQIEAEFAIPPVYTDREERALQGRNTDITSNPSSTAVISQSPHHGTANLPTEKVRGEMVVFDEGESPREWSAGKKWYVHTPLGYCDKPG